MHQPKTLPSKSSSSNTPTGVETSATEQSELVARIEQLQNKLVELEDRLLKLTGDHHLLRMAYRQQQQDTVTFTTLDRIEKLEARLDSIKPLPP